MKHRILFLVTFFIAVALLAAAPLNEPPGFAQVLPSGIKWIPSPVVPGTYRAVLFGNPDKAGPFVMRVKVPPGTRIMPHTHREERVYTVLAGEWKLGFGQKFDAETDDLPCGQRIPITGERAALSSNRPK
jgi:hypothetical protein